MAKKALVIGINSYSKSPLRGCVNDARVMGRLLTEKYEFHPGDIKYLFDRNATSEKIKKGISDLVGSATRGDTVVFFFAGHGTQIGVGEQGEVDGKNEAIVPVDMYYNSLISDDYIYKTLVEPFENIDASLTAIFDCCHSGTILRDIEFDPYTMEPTIPVLNRFLPSIIFEESINLRSVNIAMPVNGMSACKDEETAADLKDVGGGIARGAFSYAFHSLIENNAALTYGEVESAILDAVQKVSPKHKQTPQLSVVDPNRPLFTF